MKTIKPEIQSAILELLPEDGPLAIELVCQLLANMVLSIDGATIPLTVKSLEQHFAEYEGI